MLKKDIELKTKIEQVQKDHKAYGHRRIAIELKVNKKRVLRVMRLFRMKVKRSRKRPKKPDDLKKEPIAIPNLLDNSGIIIDAPNKVWVSDFTYLPYYGKFVYLATVEDVYTRKIIGWEMSVRHDANLVKQALVNALNASHSMPQILHSDQGSEYTSEPYLEFAELFGIKISMSDKASPWQNGFQESFYSGFKLELGDPEAYQTLGELVEAVAKQICYYNNDRIHSTLKCPPAVYEHNFHQAKIEMNRVV